MTTVVVVPLPSVTSAMVGFFVQAEDGIRDHCVTGVQTCALPIWLLRLGLITDKNTDQYKIWFMHGTSHRSEERRVGKECRSRWSRCQDKHNRPPQGGSRRAYHWDRGGSHHWPTALW